MGEITRGAIVRVGVDLAKLVIQVHAVCSEGRLVTGRALPRGKFMAWCGQLPRGCVVAMEASSGAHHWCRKLIALDLDARIVAAHLVSAYRSQGAMGRNVQRRSAKRPRARACASCR